MKFNLHLALGILTLSCLANATHPKGGGTIGSDSVTLNLCNSLDEKSNPSTVIIDEKARQITLDGQTYKISNSAVHTHKQIVGFNKYLKEEEAPYLAQHAKSYLILTPGNETASMNLTLVTDSNQNQWAMLFGEIDIYIGSTKDCKK